MPYSLYILDLDGTVYRGEQVLPGAAEAIAELRRRGKRLRFVTNNSRATPKWVVEKLGRMGIEAYPEEALSSGMAAGAYLAGLVRKTAYVVGEAGLIESLQNAGAQVLNVGVDGSSAAASTGQAEAVVVGIDREFTYAKMSGAMQQIGDGARFVATNADATYPVENGRMVPGSGSIVAAIKACSGVEPLLIGKPEPFMLESILAESGCAKQEVLVVGDRIGTDIEWGRRVGCPTHLVLTGVTETAPPGQRYSENLLGLLED